MLSKQQIKDSDECEKIQEQGEDMDCMNCSCNVCIAQVPKDSKLENIQQFISYAKSEGAINSDIEDKLMSFANYYVRNINS